MSGRRGRRHPRLDVYDASRHEAASTIVERGFLFAENNPRPQIQAPTTRFKPPPVTLSSLADNYANWNPSPQGSPSNTESAPPLNANENEDVGDAEDSTPGMKRKKYISSDDPNRAWLPEAWVYLMELLRSDGLGDNFAKPACASCGDLLNADSADGPTRLFRCTDCDWVVRCGQCCLARHKTMPLHRISEYNGTFFDKTTTLSDIGLVYQLGHGGHPCVAPDDVVRQMTVIESKGIHQVRYRYCACNPLQRTTNVQQCMRAGWYPATPFEPRTCATFNCLDYFRRLNVAGNVNANDFIDTLHRLTNSIDPDAGPDRYWTFGRITRQWALLHRIKRSGVWTDTTIDSIEGIPCGTLAHVCWACPNPKYNLPEKWSTVDPKYQYLYMPTIAMDANFRLKGRLRLNERHDPPLAPGSAYFLDPVPYKTHLANYVREEDVSTCIAFAALLEKDTKLATGLRNSGVAGCACARHEVILPQGMGDLQKGERYANMDYVFWSAIQDIKLPRIAVSYDVACQWKVNLFERLPNLPKSLQIKPGSVAFTFGLPTWHAAVHELSCKSANSLIYQEGVGRTDGEGIERVWSLLNPSGFATKEMGEGNRQDTLDDRIDYHNFKKNLTLPTKLRQRLLIAIEERDRQIANFDDVYKNLEPEIRDQWQKRVHLWYAGYRDDNPFLLPMIGNEVTEASVRKDLKDAEEKDRREGRAPASGTSASAFVMTGLQLEDLRLQINRQARTATTSTQKALLDQLRREYTDKLESYRVIQHIYMPGSIDVIKQLERERQTSSPPPLPEDANIWFPSDISRLDRQLTCSPDVISLETQLRKARCSDALIALRHHLHSKQYLIAFRNANVTGQRDSGRARGLIDDAGERVTIEADKYRRSREGLLWLLGDKDITTLPELHDSDIALDSIDDPDLLILAKLGKVGASKHRRPHMPTGKRIVSWIWTGGGAPKASEGVISETVRVEWSKAYARRGRWCEEVEILREEMRRVNRFLDNRIMWWEEQMPVINENIVHYPAAATMAGIRAYAGRQAHYLRQIKAICQAEWNSD